MAGRPACPKDAGVPERRCKVNMDKTTASQVNQWKARAEAAQARIAELETRLSDLCDVTGAKHHGMGWLLPFYNADGTHEMLIPQECIERRRAAAIRIRELEARIAELKVKVGEDGESMIAMMFRIRELEAVKSHLESQLARVQAEAAKMREAVTDAGRWIDGVAIEMSLIPSAVPILSRITDALECSAGRDLLERLERAEAIVAKLPKTADGVPIYPGITLYPPCGHEPFVVSSHFDEHTCLQGSCREEEWGENDYHDVYYKRYSVERCYSTRAAAEAVKGGAK